jgi:hypothetical protein
MIEPVPHAEQPRKFRPWSALYQVMTEPSATFRALAERPAILPPYLLQMAVGVIAFLAVWPITLAAAMDQVSKVPNASPASLQTIRIVSLVAGLGQALAAPWIAGLIVAGIAAFLGQFYGGSVGFKAYFSMAGYARSPLAVSGLINAAMLTGAATLQQVQSMSVSLAVFAPDASPYIKGILATINPFDIFYYVLLAIGFGALQRLKPAKGAPLAVGLYVLGLVMSVLAHVMAGSQGY